MPFKKTKAGYQHYHDPSKKIQYARVFTSGIGYLVRGMYNMGKSVANIARSTGKSHEEIRRMLK